MNAPAIRPGPTLLAERFALSRSPAALREEHRQQRMGRIESRLRLLVSACASLGWARCRERHLAGIVATSARPDIYAGPVIEAADATGRALGEAYRLALELHDAIDAESRRTR